MTAQPGWPLLAALALSIGNLFLHKPVSDVCDWALAQWGFARYNRVALVAIVVVTVAVLVPLLVRRRQTPWPPARRWVLLSLLVMAVAAQRWLLVVNIELIHFPQFGLLAALLLAAGWSGEAAWVAAAVAGILDETYQQFVIYADRTGVYLDFNDMVLNAIGASWAVVLLGASGRARDRRRRWRWLRWPHVAVALVLLLPLVAYLDPPELVPLLRASAGGNLYRVLSATEAWLWGILLWGLTVLAIDGDRSSSGSALVSLSLAVLCASGCAMAQPTARVPATAPPPFIITFWCGPPHEEFTDARAAEIAAAGFTVAGPPCEGTSNPALNRRSLDVAARHGLRLWVADYRYHPVVLERTDWEAQIAAAVAEYRDHPALGGYFIVDEPSADAFSDVAAIVRVVHAHDPHRPAYVNLLPDYIYPEHLKAPSYSAYVDGFITTVQPRLLSYDYYPFGAKKDRPTFFTNLAFMRERARRHRLPFLLIVLAMPHGGYREPSEAELAWQVFHALAYGAGGVSYFAYWTPVHVAHAETMKFRDGLIARGRPTRQYTHAARLNPEVRAIGNALAGYVSMAVADARGAVAPALPAGPLAAVGDAAITVGLFADPAERVAALLVNRDYRHGATAHLRMQAHYGTPQVFDPATAAWTPLADDTVTLAPGRARLLRW